MIKSAHPKIFSPGHNVAELKNFELHQEIFGTCKEVMKKIREVDVPVIAQVTGLAVAAGAQLAIAAGDRYSGLHFEIFLKILRLHLKTPSSASPGQKPSDFIATLLRLNLPARYLERLRWIYLLLEIFWRPAVRIELE